MVMTVMVLYHGAEFKPLAFRDGATLAESKNLAAEMAAAAG